MEPGDLAKQVEQAKQALAELPPWLRKLLDEDMRQLDRWRKQD